MNEWSGYSLAVGLFGGLALFLFGMDIMTRALKQAAGDKMRDILAKLTKNRFIAVGMGAFITSVIQSSSVTTVLMVGFISAGLMSMAQSVAVIIGANIGTTITAQILAFKVTKLALPMITVGFLLSLTLKRNDWRQYAKILLGLGLVFYGMGVMSGAMKPLRSYEPFLDFMISLDNPILAVLAGAAFTAVIQSSSATTGILIVMAGQGLIGLEAAIALALGANIGTCVTAGLASIGKPREAVRAAVVHTLFNVAGVVIWIAFIPQLVQFAHWVSPVAAGLTGVERLAAEAPRQIANVHTFFNIVNAFLFIGFTTQIARFVEWLVPDRPIDEEAPLRPKYLDESLLSTSSIALDAARREIRRLGKRVRRMMRKSTTVIVSGTHEDLHELSAMDADVNALHQKIVEYLGKISVDNLSQMQSDKLIRLMSIANDIEYIGDRISSDLASSAHKRLNEGVVISPMTIKVITNFHDEVTRAYEGALKALRLREDDTYARVVRDMKQDIANMAKDLARHEVERLTADAPKRLETYAREVELIEILHGIYKISRRIAGASAKVPVEPEVTEDAA